MDYYVQLVEGSSSFLRDVPLGVYQADSPEHAIRTAAGQWSLSSMPAESFMATPLQPRSANDP